MRRAGLAGVRPDAVGNVFPPSTKINHAARAVKALAPSQRLYDFPMPALCCELAPNQRPASGPNPGLRNRWGGAPWGSVRFPAQSQKMMLQSPRKVEILMTTADVR
jgi:hypothetical protein